MARNSYRSRDRIVSTSKNIEGFDFFYCCMSKLLFRKMSFHLEVNKNVVLKRNSVRITVVSQM